MKFDTLSYPCLTNIQINRFLLPFTVFLHALSQGFVVQFGINGDPDIQKMYRGSGAQFLVSEED